MLPNRAHRAFKAQKERLVAGEFAGFVLAEEPGTGLVLCTAHQAVSLVDAKHNWCADCGRVATTAEIRAGVHRAYEVGLGQKKFNRGKGKLKELARMFMHLSPATGASTAQGGVSVSGVEAASGWREIA